MLKCTRRAYLNKKLTQTHQSKIIFPSSIETVEACYTLQMNSILYSEFIISTLLILHRIYRLDQSINQAFLVNHCTL